MPGTITPIGVGTALPYPKQVSAGVPLDPLADPGDTNPPVLFEPPPGLTSGATEVWIIATGGANWGGCQIWLSLDGTTYAYAGTIYRGGRQGVLTAALPSHADPDTADTLSVDLTESHGQLLSGTMADADAFVTLCYCDGELVCYQTATLTAAYKYNLTYLRRGVYGTPIGAHSSGAEFARFGPNDPSLCELCRPDDPRQAAGLQHLRPGLARARRADPDELQPDRRRRGAGAGLCLGLVARQPDGEPGHRTLHLRDAGHLPRGARRQLRRRRNCGHRRRELPVQKNGTAVGTMGFAAGAATASFTMAAATPFAAGDVLTIVTPAAPDPTLANLAWTLSGTL
jgi:hypothetical protein